MMLLELQNVSKKYSRGSREFYAVDQASLSVEKGEFIALRGYSGSGKSTLFHMIAGLLEPDSGQILFEGRCIFEKTYDLSEYRNRQIGYIVQGQSVLNSFTVLENVMLPCAVSGGEGDSAGRALALLKEVGLAEYRDTYPNRLSGGEMRRTAIARALINRPKLVIADEPTSNLDEETAVLVLQLLKRISESGIGVLISTHDELYRKYADRCCVMDKGILREAVVHHSRPM